MVVDEVEVGHAWRLYIDIYIYMLHIYTLYIYIHIYIYIRWVGWFGYDLLDCHILIF